MSFGMNSVENSNFRVVQLSQFLALGLRELIVEVSPLAPHGPITSSWEYSQD
jgi:hypothetical protein